MKVVLMLDDKKIRSWKDRITVFMVHEVIESAE
jgi:hypothetical protein